MLISALTHWGFFWANTSVIYIAEIYDNYECLGPVDGQKFCEGFTLLNKIYVTMISKT